MRRYALEYNRGSRRLRFLFLWGWAILLAGLNGCGPAVEERSAPVLLTLDDYKGWEGVCDALATKTGSGLVIHSLSLMGLAEELKGSPEAIAGYCLQNKIGTERFFEVCRAIGLAYSIMEAEQVDRASAQTSAVDMVGRPCAEGHGPEFEEPPPVALAPREQPPPIIGKDTDITLAKNVEFLRPFAPEVERLSAKLFSGPSNE